MAVTNGDAKSKLIGDVRRLPLRVAGEVAWKSIKVRLSRSLVTVSSVVLAVAFLLVVVGAELANRAVHDDWAIDNQRIDDVAACYGLLDRPRNDGQLLSLLADPAQFEAASSWATTVGGQPVGVDQALPAFWNDLAVWVKALKPTDRFKVIGNEPLIRWLLALDGTVTRSEQKRIDRFLEIVATFRGVRLPTEEAILKSRLSELPQLRQALTAMRQAEAKRLEQVAAAGGAPTIMTSVEQGELDLAAMPTVGLVVGQVLPGLDAARLAAMREQLAINKELTRARDLVSDFNQAFSVGRAIEPVQIFNDELDGDPRLAILRAELNEEYGAEAITAVGAKLVRGIKISNKDDEATTLAGLKDQLKYFNKSFAGRKPIRPGQIADGSLAGDARQALLEERLAKDLGADSLALVRNELHRRNRLSTLADTLADVGFDPTGASSKTFWLVILSLMVCIVGIVNSMMMAVTERFREIATMKCLGAMDSFILKSFLIESGSVGLVGSFAGSILGVLVVLLQSTSRYGTTFWSALPAGPLAVAALAALVCGVILTVFGALLPAYQAARMHPIEAMRLET